jgi:hypothetical protein
MTYYHGTTSTVEKSILKYGTRKSKENGSEGLFVWMTPDFHLAVSYARWREKEAKTPIGGTLEYFERDGFMSFRSYKVMKCSGRVDPTARPIVFEFDLPDSWLIEESPNAPSEWRVPRRIPPSMLSVIRLKPGLPTSPLAALKGLNDSLQDIRATLLRGMAGR